jgi:hypothetical protein
MASQTARLTLLLLVAIIIMSIPAVAVVAVGWGTAGLFAMLAAMGGLFAGMGLGIRGVLWLAGASAVAAAVGVLVAPSPIASGILMLVVGATYGLGNRWGLSLWNFMYPVLAVAALAQPPKLTGHIVPDALLTGAIAVVSIVVAGLLVHLVIKQPMQKETPKYSNKVNAVYAINLTVLLAIAGYAAAALHAQVPGVWLAITIVIIIRPYQGDSVMRSLQRGGGTILGFLLAIGVAYALPQTYVYYLIGLAFVELAVLIRYKAKRPYWEYIMFITPGAVLLAGTPEQVTHYADVRLIATIAAIVLCLVIMGIERAIFWRGGLLQPHADDVSI